MVVGPVLEFSWRIPARKSTPRAARPPTRRAVRGRGRGGWDGTLVQLSNDGRARPGSAGAGAPGAAPRWGRQQSPPPPRQGDRARQSRRLWSLGGTAGPSPGSPGRFRGRQPASWYSKRKRRVSRRSRVGLAPCSIKRKGIMQRARVGLASVSRRSRDGLVSVSRPRRSP
eukprot:gene16517-biopygen2253